MNLAYFLVSLFRRVLTGSVALVSYVLTIAAVFVGLFTPLAVPSMAYVALIVFGLLGGFIRVTWEDHKKVNAFASGPLPELSIRLVPEPVPASLPTLADYETARGGTTLKEYASLRQLSRWIHAKVENTGKATARNCRGMLMNTGDEQGNPIAGFHYPDTLHWTGMQNQEGAFYSARDIQPGENVRLDICFTVESPEAGIGHQEDLLHFATDNLPKGLRTHLGPGLYTCLVRVLSDNSDPADLHVRIRWTGVSATLAIEEVQETQHN